MKPLTRTLLLMSRGRFGSPIAHLESVEPAKGSTMFLFLTKLQRGACQPRIISERVDDPDGYHMYTKSQRTAVHRLFQSASSCTVRIQHVILRVVP